MDNSLIVDGLNVAELSDEELLGRLQNLGFTAGPITETTRGVYQRKLVRLLKNEEFEDLEEENEIHAEEKFPGSPVLNSSYDSSYSGSPSISIDDLRRRPLSRVDGEKWSESPPTLSPHRPWSPDDIVSQVKPPPEEESSSFSSTLIMIVIAALLFFTFLVYYNMESAPQTPFS